MGNSQSNAFATGYNIGYVDGQNFLAKAQEHLKQSSQTEFEKKYAQIEAELKALRLENKLLKQQVAMRMDNGRLNAIKNFSRKFDS